MVIRFFVTRDLGRKDSNLRVTGSKPGALPLGDAPLRRTTNQRNLSFSILNKILEHEIKIKKFKLKKKKKNLYFIII